MGNLANRTRVKLKHDLQLMMYRRAIQAGLKTGRIRIVRSNGSSPIFLPRYTHTCIMHESALNNRCRMDILKDRDSHRTIVVFELPGVRSDEILLTVHDGMLHVQGRRSPRTPQEYTANCTGGNVPPINSDGRPQLSASYAVQELRYGAFKREVKLPDGVKVEEKLSVTTRITHFVPRKIT
jgi:HSP20 family molecular chaperone IbpA